MDKALLFKDGESVLVSAEEIKAEIYSRNNEFVDPENEFKVKYVKGAKNNGKPYFRLYYSYEDYKRLFPDRASRYEIVADMRRFQESQWHRSWKEEMRPYCELEKYTKHPITNKWKFADAYHENTNTVIEFQHSYIALDFETRNQFYSSLGINVIWLYDLSRASIRNRADGTIDILEDNARGFFRIAENLDNLKEQYVFVQVKSGMIYRVNDLFRYDIKSNLKSTIRYFNLTDVFSKEEFIRAIVDDQIIKANQKKGLLPLSKIWKNTYGWMIVENTTNNKTIMINRNQNGNMFRSYKDNCIQYKYVTCQDSNATSFIFNSNKEYSLNDQKAESKIWKLMRAEASDKNSIYGK